MPSFWKKQKGNKISQFVADLQTPSKRGGSLVVETGFPTSLIDLFVKNRDKLKKSKPKKHKSKNLKSICDDNYDDFGSDCQKVDVSHPLHASCCEFEGPTFSKVDHFEEKVDNFEEIFVNNDLSHENVIANEVPVDIINDCCKLEKKNVEVCSNPRNYVILLSILMSALCFVVVFCAKNWFLGLITLGFLLLLLENLGKSRYGLFKNCENGVWMLILKGTLVVLLALNSKWFVVGISIGACLLILLEYSGNSIFGFFKLCQNAEIKLQCILPNWVYSNEKKRVFVGSRSKEGRGFFVGSKREQNSDKGNFNNGLILESEVEDCGNVFGLKGEIEQENRDNSICNENSSLIEEEKQGKTIYEPLALESNDLEDLKNLNSSGPIGCIYLQGEKVVKLDSNDEKAKKNKNFWKKLVPRKKRNKRKTHENEREIKVMPSESIQDSSIDSGRENEQIENEHEIIDNEKGLSTSTSRSVSSSSLNQEDESETDKIEPKITFIQLDNKNPNSFLMVKEGYGNTMKYYFTAMVIPLTGLIGGRMLAIIVTVICCLVFKMARS